MRRSKPPASTGCSSCPVWKSRPRGVPRPFMCWDCGSIRRPRSCATACACKPTCAARACARSARVSTKLRLPGAELLAAVERHPGLPTRAHLAQAMAAGGHVDTRGGGIPQIPGQGQGARICRRMARARDGDRLDSSPPAAWPPWPIPRAIPSPRARAGVLLGDFTAAGGAALEVVSGGNGAQHVDTCAALAGEARSDRIGGLGFSQPASRLESLGPLP